MKLRQLSKQLTGVAVALLTCGCSTSIRFAADTVVDEDGRVVRTTTMSSSGDSTNERLRARYDLVPGGVWTESVDEQPSIADNARPRRVYNHHYTLTRQFVRTDAIGSDFRRLGNRPDRVANNAIKVETRSYWFVDVYRYEETFRDISTPESISAALNRLFSRAIDIIAEEVADRSSGGLTLEEARERLAARFEPLLEDFLSFITEECIAEFLGGDECFSQLEEDAELRRMVELLDDRNVLIAEIASVFPPPDGVAAGEWLEALDNEILGDVEDQLDDLFDTAWGEAIEDDLFGAHGFALFETYPFELSLTLPGVIVASNADTQASGRLSWAFDYDDFWLNARTLHASSRIVRLDRILFASFLAVLIALGISWRVLHVRRAQ